MPSTADETWRLRFRNAGVADAVPDLDGAPQPQAGSGGCVSGGDGAGAAAAHRATPAAGHGRAAIATCWVGHRTPEAQGFGALCLSYLYRAGHRARGP